MTTENLQGIKDAIANLKEKRIAINKMEDNLEQAEFEYSELYAELIEIADEIAALRQGGNDDSSVKLFPVDEPLEKPEPVENWEAKEPTAVSDETFHQLLRTALDEAYQELDRNGGVLPPIEPAPEAFSGVPSGVSDVSGHQPTGQEPDATPDLPDEPETATGGDAADDKRSTFL